MTIIALGSTSAIKIQAVQAALTTLGCEAVIMPVKAASGVPEQPFDDQTMLGAMNRARQAAQQVGRFDLALAIESGIYSQDGRYFDRAVVVALLPSGDFVSVLSDAVEFPADAVQETLARGTDVWTCGKVLAEWQRVEKHDDPHFSLVGKPRAQFINEAVAALFTELNEHLSAGPLQSKT